MAPQAASSKSGFAHAALSPVWNFHKPFSTVVALPNDHLPLGVRMGTRKFLAKLRVPSKRKSIAMRTWTRFTPDPNGPVLGTLCHTECVVLELFVQHDTPIFVGTQFLAK